MNEITPSSYAISICMFYRTVYDLTNQIVFYGICLCIIKQNFNILRHLFGKILHLKFNVYHAVLTRASDLKLFVGGVYNKKNSR